MYKMTKEDKFKQLQNSIKSLKENEPLDQEEQIMLKEWEQMTIEDFKDETEEEFQKRKYEVEKLKIAKENNDYELISIDKKGNEKVIKSKQTKLMTINTNIAVIDRIKEKAIDLGLNYQTLINMLLKQYADGKIRMIL